MFGTLRRCSASIRCRAFSQAHAVELRPFFHRSLPVQRSSLAQFNLVQSISSRAISQDSRKSQNAAAAAVYEAEAEQELHGARAPSDKPVDEAVAMGPATMFQQLADQGLVDENVIRTITQRMGLHTMTQVQSLTIHEALTGKDVLAQAKTGTGKTIGFLLPVLQNILSKDPTLAGSRRAPRQMKFGQRASDIRAIIISPTRELAEQIAVEARKLTQGTNVVIQTAVGGTQKSLHMRQMQREGCHILVATPGRLKDILSDTTNGVQAPMLSALVLDEADRLMDQGFWPEIQAISDLLPDPAQKDRQTLMYSATVPSEVVDLVRNIMKPDLHYIRTVQENEQPTHERVPQHMVVVPGLENYLPTLLELCQREIDAAETSPDKRPFKAIVYFNATAETNLAADIFLGVRRSNFGQNGRGEGFLGNTRVFQIHSRLSQGQRTAAAEHFRNAESAIFMSSDVTSRGMDFPGVTHIIQMGLPNNQDTYVHRLGRTARAGQEGEGWLIVAQVEMQELRSRLRQMPINRDESLDAPRVNLSLPEAQRFEKVPAETQKFFAQVSEAASKCDPVDLEKMYMALLGTHQHVRDKRWLIESMNRMAQMQWRMEKPPGIPQGLQNKLGLRGLPGISSAGPRTFEDDLGGGFGGRRGFGGERSSGYGRDRGGFDGGRGGYGDKGSMDRQGGGFNRQGGGFERRSGGFDRQSSGFERQDRKGGGFDRQSSGFNRRGDGDDGGFERQRGGRDRERNSFGGR